MKTRSSRNKHRNTAPHTRTRPSQGVGKARDLIDERTGGKYTSPTDGAGQRAEDLLDGPGEPKPDNAQP